MVLLVIQIIEFIMGVLSLVFPYSVGLSSNNLYLTFLRGVCKNFTLVFDILLLVQILLNFVSIKKNTELMDKRTDITLTVIFGITILISYI